MCRCLLVGETTPTLLGVPAKLERAPGGKKLCPAAALAPSLRRLCVLLLTTSVVTVGCSTGDATRAASVCVLLLLPSGVAASAVLTMAASVPWGCCAATRGRKGGWCRKAGPREVERGKESAFGGSCGGGEVEAVAFCTAAKEQVTTNCSCICESSTVCC